MKSVAKILTENQKNLKDASYIGYDDENDTVLIVCPHKFIDTFQKMFNKYGNQSLYYDETETGAVMLYM
jgi:hypothetical protein